MAAVDLYQPIELNDGTPLVLTDTGGLHTFDIALEKHGEKHPAFPIHRDHGSARHEDGLVLSNHKYFVRNRATPDVDRIDLSFRKGDKVNTFSRSSVIIIAIDEKRGEAELSDGTNKKLYLLHHTCHNHGAPFEKVEHDKAQTYQDGYMSGLFFGLHGQHYAAGGPNSMTMSDSRPCRHKAEHDRIVTERNANWKEGWKNGQSEAKRRKRLDPTKPLRLRKPDGSTAPVEKICAVPSGYALDGFIFKPNGVCTDLQKRYILENIPMPAVLECRRFGIFGQDHTSLFDTLEEVSAHWWNTRDEKRGTKQLNGEFIVAVQQERENGNLPWTTNISGPLEPLANAWNHKVHGRQAEMLGWAICEVRSDGHPPWELSKCDDSSQFTSDAEVHRHVVSSARSGFQLQKLALEFLKENSPEEYTSVLETYALGDDA